MLHILCRALYIIHSPLYDMIKYQTGSNMKVKQIFFLNYIYMGWGSLGSIAGESGAPRSYYCCFT